MTKLGGDISVDDLWLDYAGVRALFGVSFAVEAGTTPAVLGPNGAGKSSLGRSRSPATSIHHGARYVSETWTLQPCLRTASSG